MNKTNGNMKFVEDLPGLLAKRSNEYLEKAGKLLCENRWSYSFNDSVEKQIMSVIIELNLTKNLIGKIIYFLNGNDVNLRVGAAELLGSITPSSMKNTIIFELNNHLNDHYTRDYVYGEFQGDEDDVRTVSDCATRSIKKLNNI